MGPYYLGLMDEQHSNGEDVLNGTASGGPNNPELQTASEISNSSA